MRTLIFIGLLTATVSGCTTAAKAPHTPSPETAAPTPTPTTIEGTWFDEGGDSYNFLEDGSFEAPTANTAALEMAEECSKSGFDVSACQTPKFQWLGHPADSSKYLLAMSMPMMGRSGENGELECFCPPEPGLPFSVKLVENRLTVNALQPNGAPIPGGGFELSREKTPDAP